MKRIAGGKTVIYVYNATGELAQEYGSPMQSPGVQFLTVDHLGSTRMVTSGATGEVLSRTDYEPFGTEIATSSRVAEGYGGDGSIRRRFTGKERDAETGLDYFLARYYSGGQGRFTSADKPLADQDEADPQSWNLYTYARNSPLKYTDPDGQRVYICIRGGQCFDVDDSAYPNLQPGNPGVVLPTFNFGRDEVSTQAITCGGQYCGTATYINDNPGLTPVLHPIQDFRDKIALLNPRSWLAAGIRGSVKTVAAQSGKGKPRIHPGKQGKHIPGHNNFQPGKSELTHPDPQGLLDKSAGTGQRVSDSKEVVDFGETIGTWVGQNGERAATTRGTIHYDASGGAHIVPARP